MDVLNNFYLAPHNNGQQSERYHKQTIAYCENKLSKQPKCIGALCDWIASHHELAQLYQQQGALESAQQCLLIPHQSMLYMAHHCDDQEQAEIAQRALHVTLPPLIRFADQHPPCDTCLKSLHSQLAMLQQHKKNDH